MLDNAYRLRHDTPLVLADYKGNVVTHCEVARMITCVHKNVSGVLVPIALV